MACCLSQKQLKYKQCVQHPCEQENLLLNRMGMNDILTIDEALDRHLSKFITFAANDCGCSGSAHDLMVNWLHSFFLKTNAKDSKKNNPNLLQAIIDPFANECWKAAVKEIETFEGITTWEVVVEFEFQECHNIIYSTWAFKLKQFPYGQVKKFKACFCACGVQQLEGIDFF